MMMIMLFAFTEQVEAGGQAAMQGVEVHTNRLYETKRRTYTSLSKSIIGRLCRCRHRQREASRWESSCAAAQEWYGVTNTNVFRVIVIVIVSAGDCGWMICVYLLSADQGRRPLIMSFRREDLTADKPKKKSLFNFRGGTTPKVPPPVASGSDDVSSHVGELKTSKSELRAQTLRAQTKSGVQNQSGPRAQSGTTDAQSNASVGSVVNVLRQKQQRLKQQKVRLSGGGTLLDSDFGRENANDNDYSFHFQQGPTGGGADDR